MTLSFKKFVVQFLAADMSSRYDVCVVIETYQRAAVLSSMWTQTQLTVSLNPHVLLGSHKELHLSKLQSDTDVSCKMS